MDKNTIKGYVFAVLSAVIYGSMPLMAKNIYADGVNPLSLVFLRNSFSLVPLAVLAYTQKRTLKIPLRLLPKVSIIAFLGCCLTPILLFSSYRFIPSGTATVIHFAYPAFVVLGGILFLREKPQTRNILCVLMCVGGISLFYSPGQPLDPVGSMLSLASAVTFAAYVIILARFDTSEISGFLFAFHNIVISSIVTFVICIVSGSLVLPSTLTGWGLCLLLSLLVTTGAVVLFQQSAFLIGGERVSILSTLEPITSLVIGVIVFNEALGLPVLVGSVMVVAASILTALFDIKRSSKNSSVQERSVTI